MNKLFKIIALLEGTSLLILLFFAMPMKYIFDQPIYVKMTGMVHGILFIFYIILSIMLMIDKNWAWKKFGAICLASIVPFGTFYIEKKYLRDA